MLEPMIFKYLTLLDVFFSDSTSELLHVKFRSNFLSVMYVGARLRRSSFPLSPRSRVLGFSQFSNRRSELISPLRLRREPQTQTIYFWRDAILHDCFNLTTSVIYQWNFSNCLLLFWFTNLKRWSYKSPFLCLKYMICERPSRSPPQCSSSSCWYHGVGKGEELEAEEDRRGARSSEFRYFSFLVTRKIRGNQVHFGCMREIFFSFCSFIIFVCIRRFELKSNQTRCRQKDLWSDPTQYTFVHFEVGRTGM